MKSKEIKNVLSLLAKLDISFIICFLLAVVLYVVSYSVEHIADDIFWVLLVFAMFTTYYFLRQDVIDPLTKLGNNAREIQTGTAEKLQNIETDTPEFADIVTSFNQVIANMERATNFVREIEGGNLEAEIAVGNHEKIDNLSQALLNMRNTLLQIDTEENQRSWATQGVAMLSEILRNNNQDVKGLSRQIMAGLVPYIGATQGAIFVLQEEKETSYQLVMTGMYAYGRQKYVRRELLVDKKYADSLIGQVFLEGASLQLNQIPEGYLDINSGLGDAPPKYLFLVPLVVDGNSYGVLEIASFQTLEAHQIKFIERITESIALTIATVRINEQTRLLLEESQRQAEQLKSQEEEMRQNLEELATTQEEMERKNRELETANQRITANTQILEKALQKAKDMQRDLEDKNAQMQAQEEEMRQNLEELQSTQEELAKQKKELELAYQNMKDDQDRLIDQNKQIEAQEHMMRQTLEQLQQAQLDMEKHQRELEQKNKKLQSNQDILKKFMDRANESDSKHKATIREKETLIQELQQKLARYEGQA
ncbi:MAG: GAF domain-containing protein [Bacteroidetes bacterium]|nr:MAG: GAF domain-containing protein [Bacteroidota bacterium]